MAAGPPLWRATVPVFLAVLDRMEAELGQAEARLGAAVAAALAQRPSAGMMPAARQVATAVQFTLRIAYPLAGERVPGAAGAAGRAGAACADGGGAGASRGGWTRRRSRGRRRGW